jgi:hypothetical protein
LCRCEWFADCSACPHLYHIKFYKNNSDITNLTKI